MEQINMESIIEDLFECGSIKFGHFTLKSGILSPIYIDLRALVSQIQLLKDVSNLLIGKIHQVGIEYDLICGVPYTALPIATCMCVSLNKPMIMRRKEEKNYGTKQLVEGKYKEGDVALIIEDVISSGTSILETALTLHQSKIKVNHAFVFLDRQLTGKANLDKLGIKVHCVLELTDVINHLAKVGKITEAQASEATKWMKENTAQLDHQVVNECKLSRFNTFKTQIKTLKLEDRRDSCKHPLAKRLLTIMINKKTNLCVSIDVTTSQTVLDLAQSIGPHICVLKTHVDILNDFNQDFTLKLKSLAQQFDFLIFEDRKFSDIGKTAEQQLNEGIYKISEWADLVTAHAISGPGVLKALNKKVTNNTQLGCLLVAEMSSQGNLITKNYTKSVYSMALKHEDFVVGLISQSKIALEPHLLHFTPGVNIETSGDKLGQQYVTPEDAVIKRGADIIIVGAGIVNAADQIQAAITYKNRGFDALLKTIQEHN